MKRYPYLVSKHYNSDYVKAVKIQAVFKKFNKSTWNTPPKEIEKSLKKLEEDKELLQQLFDKEVYLGENYYKEHRSIRCSTNLEGEILHLEQGASEEVLSWVNSSRSNQIALLLKNIYSKGVCPITLYNDRFGEPFVLEGLGRLEALRFGGYEYVPAFVAPLGEDESLQLSLHEITRVAKYALSHTHFVYEIDKFIEFGKISDFAKI